MKDKQCELAVNAKLENLSVIADFIATTMTKLGAEEGIYEVQLAVDEACTNIVKYAYAHTGGTIAITCELQGSDFVTVIRDKGRPFSPNSVPLPDLETKVEERGIGGLGIYLMREVMDEVSYGFDAEEGNTLTMRKTLTETGQ